MRWACSQPFLAKVMWKTRKNLEASSQALYTSDTPEHNTMAFNYLSVELVSRISDYLDPLTQTHLRCASKIWHQQIKPTPVKHWRVKLYATALFEILKIADKKMRGKAWGLYLTESSRSGGVAFSVSRVKDMWKFRLCLEGHEKILDCYFTYESHGALEDIMPHVMRRLLENINVVCKLTNYLLTHHCQVKGPTADKVAAAISMDVKQQYKNAMRQAANATKILDKEHVLKVKTKTNTVSKKRRLGN